MSETSPETLSMLKAALSKIKELKDQLALLKWRQTEPIAIIGMGCRFPGGANNPDAFWELLNTGRDAIQPLEPRWALVGARPSAQVPGWAGLLTEAVDEFDAAFFGISPREARSMDPQQRLLLEVAWESFENAAIPLRSLDRSRTGVFIGACSNDYLQTVVRQPWEEKDAYSTTGNALSVAAGRLSYMLGLQGPAVTIDTACSSSLVAIHQACQSLRAAECDLALAGGVNLILSAEIMENTARLQALSPDGRCKTFDASANGFVRGEGCGLVALKRVSDAQRDGDRIWAVIRSSAVNQDGRSTGLTTPNVLAQEALLREALKNARVEPLAVGYVETHGTGTSIGDPIEVEALRAVLGSLRADGTSCVLGALKTNLGHLEAAAGVAGLIKAVLALWHERIPKNLNFRTLNTHIDLAGTALSLATESVPWPRGGRPRIAGVSSFGVSGTNAHAVLEEAPRPQLGSTGPKRSGDAEGQGPSLSGQRPELLLLSARSSASLSRLAENLVPMLRQPELHSFRDIAYTASVRHSHLEHRLVVLGTSKEEWAQSLESYLKGIPKPGTLWGTVHPSDRPKVVFVFPGQGSQWLGMGRQLYAQENVFRSKIDECDKVIQRIGGFSILAELHADASQARLDRQDIVQPILMSMQLAIAALWRSWGIEPEGVIGHSMGEVAAAQVAGILSLEDAALIICTRSRLAQRVRGQGMMILTELTRDEAAQAIRGLEDSVSIAASNGPQTTILSGGVEAIEQLARTLENQSIFCRRIQVEFASHSPQMDPLLGDLAELLRNVQGRRSAKEMYSTVTAELVDGPELNGSYWVRNLRQPVQFMQGVQKLMRRGYRIYVEVSPHPILVPSIEELVGAAEGIGVVLWSLRRDADELRSMQEALGKLHIAGYPVDFRFQHRNGGQVAPLPTYPFQRERFWIDKRAEQIKNISQPALLLRTASSHPLLGTSTTLSSRSDVRIWQNEISIESHSYLADHLVQGQVVVPGAAYLEMAVAAATELWNTPQVALKEVSFERFLDIHPGQPVRIQLELTIVDATTGEFQIASQPAGSHEWLRHATGTVRRDLAVELPPNGIGTQAPQRAISEVLSNAEIVAVAEQRGVTLGPAFHGLQQVWIGESEITGAVELPKPIEDEKGYQIHPAFLDTFLQVCFAFFRQQATGDTSTWVPVKVQSLQMFRLPGKSAMVHARRVVSSEASAQRQAFDFRIADSDGAICLELTGVELASLDRENQRTQDLSGLLYQMQWQRAESLAAKPPAGRPVGPWLIFADRQGTGDLLIRKLLGMGLPCIRVGIGAAYQQENVAEYVLDPRSRTDYQRLLKDAFSEGSCGGVVHLWSLDARSAKETRVETLELEPLQSCVSATYLAQALLTGGRALPEGKRLYLITRQGQPAGDGGQEICVAQSAIWGLGRSLSIEHPELGCKRIDLGYSKGAQDELEQLMEELFCADAEDQVALRSDGRYVARLVRTSLGNPSEAAAARTREPAAGRPFRLGGHSQGILEDLAWYEMEREPPGPNDVEIEVVAAGLNFKDVLIALALIRDGDNGIADPGIRLGGECAGRVVAVGANVSAFKVGQEVIAIGQGAFASHLTTRQEFVVGKPAKLSWEQAATLSLAYMTADYSLREVAKLKAGERVLIHAGAGGVGQAAIQVAKQIGAEIYATAGSQEKRELLRVLGVHHVLDSRSLSFVTEIQRLTAGSGVDVVLNSLAGEFIQASLSLLREGGRFVEIGRRDYIENKPLRLRPFLKGLSFSFVDLGQLMNLQPLLIQRLLFEIIEQLEGGLLKPLPCQSFAAADVPAAFRYMAQARHTGKLALDMQDAAVQIVKKGKKDFPGIRSDATYLITGGLRGLGLAFAQDLVKKGARHLVLVARSLPSEDTHKVLTALAQQGVEVLVRQVDVANSEQMDALFRQIKAELPPLRGVAHCAVVLDDHTLPELGEEHFARVFAPKIQGAWLLHEQTADMPLDFMVLYSSAAGILGSPGQANYAAANACLDALAHLRAGRGLPTISVQLGGIADVGLVAGSDARANRLDARGAGRMTSAESLELIAQALRDPKPELALMRFDMKQWAHSYPQIRALPVWAPLLEESAKAGPDKAVTASKWQTLAAATEIEQLVALEQELLSIASRVLQVNVEKLDPNRPLQQYGLDSLMGAEIRNLITYHIGVKMAASAVWTYGKVRSLAKHLHEQMFGHSLPVPTDSILPYAQEMLADIKLAAKLPKPQNGHPIKTIAAPKKILLTGGSGFIGAYLIEQLLQRTEAHVYCIVRAPDHQSGALRLRKNMETYGIWQDRFAERLVAVSGDLALPRLGLTEATFDALSIEIDSIFHNGATVDWLRSYQDLRAANVLSALETLRFALCGREKAISYVSSGVCLEQLMVHRLFRAPDLQAEAAFDYILNDEFISRYLMNMGYSQSKWVAEEIMLFARSQGQVISIFRVPFACGDSRSGAWNTKDYVCRLLKSCVDLQMTPKLEMYLPLFPVDYVAQEIVDLSLQEHAGGRVFQLEAPDFVKWSSIMSWMRSQGYSLTEVEPEEWLANVRRQRGPAADKGVAPLLPLLEGQGSRQRFIFPTAPSKAGALVGQLTVEPFISPEVRRDQTLNNDLMQRYFQYFQEIGFFPVPPSRMEQVTQQPVEVFPVARAVRMDPGALAELRQGQLSALFRLLDRDGGGHLTWPLFSFGLGEVARIRQWSTSSDSYKHLEAAYRIIWTELLQRLGRNGDGRLQRAELLAFPVCARLDIADIAKLPVWLSRIGLAMYRLLDMDEKRAVTAKELELFLRAIGSSADAVAVFSQLDFNAKGVLTPEEAMEVFVHWLLSEDPLDPVNLLLRGLDVGGGVN